MNLINEKVLEPIKNWSNENKDKEVFPVISERENSYYTERKSDETYLMEYDFRNIKELRDILQEYMDGTEEKTILGRMAMLVLQNDPQRNVNYTVEKISDYIYRF